MSAPVRGLRPLHRAGQVNGAWDTPEGRALESVIGHLTLALESRFVVAK